MSATDLIHPRPQPTDLSRHAAERHAVLTALAEKRAADRQSPGAQRSAALRTPVFADWLRRRRLT
ncbi:MAG TPA: hypothetical protein VIT65_27370 [Microlunatus sp.]